MSAKEEIEMHKPVRYHITESNDQPVVRSVAVTTRTDQDGEQHKRFPVEESVTENHRWIFRSSLARKLKSGRTPAPGA